MNRRQLFTRAASGAVAVAVAPVPTLTAAAVAATAEPEPLCRYCSCWEPRTVDWFETRYTDTHIHDDKMTDTIVNRWVVDRDTVTTSRRRDPKPAFGLISIVAGGDMVLSSDGGGVWIDAIRVDGKCTCACHLDDEAVWERSGYTRIEEERAR